MPPEVAQQREVHLPSKGAKFGIGLGILLLAASIVVLFWPLQLTSNEGSAFLCGSGYSPPTEDFPKSVCGALSQRSRLLSGLLALAAAVVVATSFWVYGTVRSVRLVESDESL